MPELKEAPVAVQLAKKALEILAAEDTALAEESRKKLPGFALRLAAAGEGVTVERLLESARAREIDRLPEPKQETKTYAEIVTAQNATLNEVKIWIIGLDNDRYADLDSIKSRFPVGENIDDRMGKCVDVLRNAATLGNLDTLKYMIETHNISLETTWDAGLSLGELLQYKAALYDHVDIVKYLVEDRGAPASNKALQKAFLRENMNVANYYVQRKDPRLIRTVYSPLNLRGWLLLMKHRDVSAAWRKRGHQLVPRGLEKCDPSYFKQKAYAAAQAMLLRETGEVSRNLKLMAFYASSLFGTEDRVLQYLEKWGKGDGQPLHDLVYMIKLPEKKSAEIDLKAWGDAVLKCGPSMATLVKFADRLPVPEKSNDGKTWSMRKTRDKVAQFAYKKAKQNPALAALCMEHNVDEKDFNKALKISRKASSFKNIPDIVIEGEEFGMQGATFHRLAANDIRGLFLGVLTDCCQSIGGAGAKCAEFGFKSKNSGFYVVENAKGEILGQTWAWRGEGGRLVFDSLETLGKSVTPEQWTTLAKKFAEALARTPGNVTAFYIGKGGATPASLGTAFRMAAEPPAPLHYKGYRDSRRQVVVWRKNGDLNA